MSSNQLSFDSMGPMRSARVFVAGPLGDKEGRHKTVQVGELIQNYHDFDYLREHIKTLVMRGIASTDGAVGIAAARERSKAVSAATRLRKQQVEAANTA